MKKYFILLLMSLFLLQGCDWLRGSEGKTGIAGIVGPSGIPGETGETGETGKTGLLNSNPTLKDLAGYKYLVDSVTFQTYVDGLDNQTWKGTVQSLSPRGLNSTGAFFRMYISDSGGFSGYVYHSGKTIEKSHPSDPKDWRTHNVAEINSTEYKFKDSINVVVKITRVSSNNHTIFADLVSISK